MLLSKVAIDDIFGNYTDEWVRWASFPPHVLVYLDYTAESYRPKQFDWRLPEASLYEDMCVAYNGAVRCGELASAMEVPVPAPKLRDCFLRTAVLSAFYFVEAYLNGVAFDYQSRHANNISPQDTRLLLEWDQQANREKWITLKEKIQAYPKIILGLQHPPLTETNSEEMKLLISTAKEVRDAIVHQAPRPNPLTKEVGPKVKSFMHLRSGDTTEIVDAAISLVQRLNEILGQNGIMLDWLVGRDATGKFPEKAFV